MFKMVSALQLSLLSPLVDLSLFVEVTIEEWIAMMEQNQLKEMTNEEREKYEARKKVWLEKRREKEERMRIEEEEKFRLAKERMNFEYR